MKHDHVNRSHQILKSMYSIRRFQRYLPQTSAQHSCSLPWASSPEATRPIITNIQINVFQILPIK